jgi:hypothetical protein
VVIGDGNRFRISVKLQMAKRRGGGHCPIPCGANERSSPLTATDGLQLTAYGCQLLE